MTLQPSVAAAGALRNLLSAYEGFLRWLDEAAPQENSSNLVVLHRTLYEAARARTGLPAQAITLGFRDWTARRRGERPVGMPLDARLYSVKGVGTVSLATLAGRVAVPFRVAGYGGAWPGGAPARLVDAGATLELWAEMALDERGLPPQEVLMTTESALSRIGRVIAGMAHAAIDRAEESNPESVLEQALREIDGAAEEVRVELGKAAAERHRLQARRDELAGELRTLDEQLKVAVIQGRDDLAEAGVGRQLDVEAQIKVLDKLLGDVDQRIGSSNETLDAVKASRREAERRLHDLKASRRTTSDAAGAPTLDALSRAATRVERAEAVVSRVTSVPNGFGGAKPEAVEALNALAREHAIKERLARLKAGA